MARYSTDVVSAFCVMVLCVVVTTAQDQCVSCSYNYAGDGTRDFKCVTDPYNHPATTNISCDFALFYRCVVKAVYDSSEFRQVQSLARGCFPASTIPADGCINDYPRPSCYSVCDSTLCNSQDGRLYQGDTIDDGNGASALQHTLFLTLSLCSVWRLVA